MRIPGRKDLSNVLNDIDFWLRKRGRLQPGQWWINFAIQRLLRINAGAPFMVHFTSRVTGARNIRIGKDVNVSFAVSGNCYIQGRNGVDIGDDTIFGPGVKIISANHDAGLADRWTNEDPVRIGCRCWIGANAVILPGVVLGDDCVVGAGAVVTKSFPAGTVIGGNPAGAIGTRTA